MLSNSLVSLAHQRAALAWQRGNANRWVTAFYAARVVGLLEKGLTISIARDINCEVDTVERLAMAAKAYRFLFRHGCADSVCRNKLRQARRQLGYSHFVSAWKALVRESNPTEVLAEVLTASDSGGSVKALEQALRGQVVGGGEFQDELLVGEYRLPTFDPDSDLFRQALQSGAYRVVLVDSNAETVIVRYP